MSEVEQRRAYEWGYTQAVREFRSALAVLDARQARGDCPSDVPASVQVEKILASLSAATWPVRGLAMPCSRGDHCQWVLCPVHAPQSPA